MTGEKIFVEHPSKWEWWRVKDGEWDNLSRTGRMDWLAGELIEMAKEYGLHSDLPVLKRETDDVSIIVYGLKTPPITKATIDKVDEFSGLGIDDWTDEVDKKHDEMLEDEGCSFYYFFKDVYPSSHLVYVHYSNIIEAYGVFCASWKDMLDVVSLVSGGKQ
jgi:hypothetical protein